MGWQWQEDEGSGSARKREEYECSRCHRRVYAYPDGYLPIHRHRGQRDRCESSQESVKLHKKK